MEVFTLTLKPCVSCISFYSTYSLNSCLEVHNGEVQEFEMNVTRSFKNDAMLRQITEAVQIDNTEQGRLMNTRAEWNMTRVPRATIT